MIPSGSGRTQANPETGAGASPAKGEEPTPGLVERLRAKRRRIDVWIDRVAESGGLAPTPKMRVRLPSASRHLTQALRDIMPFVCGNEQFDTPSFHETTARARSLLDVDRV